MSPSNDYSSSQEDENCAGRTQRSQQTTMDSVPGRCRTSSRKQRTYTATGADHRHYEQDSRPSSRVGVGLRRHQHMAKCMARVEKADPQEHGKPEERCERTVRPSLATNSSEHATRVKEASSKKVLAAFTPGCEVLLFSEGRKVGKARLMKPAAQGESMFQRNLHNQELSKYEGQDQFLVVIHSPLIAEEFKHFSYRYKYGGVEAPPLRLGDMQNGFYAWNLRELVPGPVSCGSSPQISQGEKARTSERVDDGGRSLAGPPNNNGAKPPASDEESEVKELGTDCSEDHDYVPTVAEEVGGSSRGGKRKYTYRERRQRLDRRDSSLSKRRKATVSIINERELGRYLCCSRKKCFQRADHLYLCAQIKRVMCMSQSERRQVLKNMFDARMHAFVFNGNAVCASFLQTAFGFSHDLQSSVKGTPASQPLPGVTSLPKSKTCEKRDAVISFLERLAESCGDSMPDRNEQHLPFFTKENVYDVFGDEYEKLYPDDTPPSMPYFYETWRLFCPQIKVRKVHRFAKCGTCERLRALQEKATSNPTILQELQKQKQQHNALIATERREYQKKMDKAKLHPDQYCSFIIDGADQSAFGLPHFPLQSKDSRGHTMAVKLVGVLEHGPLKHLSLFLMTEQYETGANHIVEALHRTLMLRVMTTSLPKTMFIQLDNSSRENKNKYLFAYIESLVAMGVTCEVYVSFLPVGHTHADIDQTFSCTSRRLRSTAAVTMQDMIRELSLSYTPTPRVSHMKGIINFSGLCELQKCLKPIQGFTQYHYFHFLRKAESRQTQSASGETERYYATTCLVREYSKDEWKPLFGNSKGGFLKSVPDLQRTPPTAVVSPQNLTEVNKRLESEEVRINNASKMELLRALRDEVYRTDAEPFHWDLSTSFELKGAYKRGDTQSESSDETMTAEAEPLLELGYKVNEFVAVRIKNATPTVPFWIAKVLEVKKNHRAVPFKLKVHWYQLNRGRNAFDGSYIPSTVDNEKETVPWIVTLSVDTVMHTFQSLTSGMFLRVSEKKAIRAALKLIKE